MKRLHIFLFLIVLTSEYFLSAQTDGTPVSLRYLGNSTYYLVERSNWSKYVNGSYIGLTHRETRANITARGSTADGQAFSGFFYVLEETVRDMSAASRGIDGIQEAAFVVTPEGHLHFTKDPGYPSLREFPVYPDADVQPGDRWQAEGKRIVDPKNDGKKTALTILVAYEFVGSELYNEKRVYRIKAKYATRMNKYLKTRADDPELENATGTHDVDILVDAESGAAILILDRLDETFFYKDGGSVRYKGNTALFTEAPVPVNKAALVPRIADIAEKAAGITGGTAKKTSQEDQFAGSGGVHTGTQSDSNTTTATDRSNEQKPLVAAAPAKKAADRPAEKPSVTPPPPDTEAGNTKPFTVEDTPEGIRLSIRDIRFQADSDTILPEEAWRLDSIAETLRLVPNGRFLVEGHTAAVGKPDGEKKLSVERAKRIADELVKRGLKSEQFMYAGYGGTKPVADNATAKGRAQNRRVEITILE